MTIPDQPGTRQKDLPPRLHARTICPHLTPRWAPRGGTDTVGPRGLRSVLHSSALT
jgi:hypothetical protein